MGLLERLDEHGVPYDKAEATERLNIFIKGLRRDPSFDKDLKAFVKQKGGDQSTSISIPINVEREGDDFLGPHLRWIIDVIGSPYVRALTRILFTVIFFISYLEKIPFFGSIISTALDITLMVSKITLKTIQRSIPVTLGLLPIPWSSIFGLIMAGLFGMVVWPIFAIISFSRQDFAAAIESMVRGIPPPMGDGLADMFLETNRAIAKVDAKRVKLVEDITTGINLISQVASDTKKNAETLVEQTKESAEQGVRKVKNIVEESPEQTKLALENAKSSIPTMSTPAIPSISTPKMPSIPKMPTLKGGKRLSRRKHMKNKWRNKTLRRK